MLQHGVGVGQSGRKRSWRVPTLEPRIFPEPHPLKIATAEGVLQAPNPARPRLRARCGSWDQGARVETESPRPPGQTALRSGPIDRDSNGGEGSGPHRSKDC
ncbi:hypothetical protein NDU88_003969 [Pleurodeles waltl]|uniref:Uncharacterized protein n=1 Tax=Pleurodeles waltl TaxID=8319 RepID=A0AAV7REM6_PLEWA|nr:hypothetical protein NDU88_003969 [Pleurodeles waltl]